MRCAKFFVVFLTSLLIACGGGGGGGKNESSPLLSLLAGSIQVGLASVDGTGVAARFSNPDGVATDPSGNVFVADYNNHIIRKITPAGVVTTVAGTVGTRGSSDGTGVAAKFNFPTGVATDASGNVYVADQGNHIIRKISPEGVVTTLAGTAGSAGSADGNGSAAGFSSPTGLATDASGNVYVADNGNNTIRKITSAGFVTTLAGTAGKRGNSDGTGAAATFNSPHGVAADASGILYVTDTGRGTIRKITPAGVVTTLAGTPGVYGSADGTGAAASFYTARGIATDAKGNVYVTDINNFTLRKITPAGVVTTLAGSAGTRGNSDGIRAAAKFNLPLGLATDASGNLYVSDSGNQSIRKVSQIGEVTTLAGMAGEVDYGSADGTGATARFNAPRGVATDTSGNVYVADRVNHTIRKITSAGVVTTLAGSPGVAGSTDGIGAAARFRRPYGVATDAIGNVYVAEWDNFVVRKITPEGVVTTMAGTQGTGGGSADGIGAAARFYILSGIATDANGNVYVADNGNHNIRKITSAGVVTTLAGTAGTRGSSDGTAAAARFDSPLGVATDASGNVYVADQNNHIIRKITPAGVVTTLAGSPGVYGSADGTGAAARFDFPRGVATDASGNVYVADTSNHTIRKITPDGVVTTLAGSAGSAGFQPGILPGILWEPSGIAIDGSKIYFSTNNGIGVIN